MQNIDGTIIVWMKNLGAVVLLKHTCYFEYKLLFAEHDHVSAPSVFRQEIIAAPGEGASFYWHLFGSYKVLWLLQSNVINNDLWKSHQESVA